jgi:hypothetical protein
MTEEPASPSRRETASSLAKNRPTKGFERREAIFAMFASGLSHQPIASTLDTSVDAVRRSVDIALADRRLDAPERYARLQVARLTKALSRADYWLERGDVRALAPYLRIVAALDRYHGLDRRERPARPPRARIPRPAPPLAQERSETEAGA